MEREFEVQLIWRRNIRATCSSEALEKAITMRRDPINSNDRWPELFLVDCTLFEVHEDGLVIRRNLPVERKP